jgi:hypothetical protein
MNRLPDERVRETALAPEAAGKGLRVDVTRAASSGSR